MGFGKKLSEKMNARGIKQIDLVNALGIPKTTISSMLSRDNTKVEIDTFLKICDYLGCAPEDFSEEVKEASDESSHIAFTADEKELLATYKSVNKEGQAQILIMARLVAESKQYRSDSTVKVYRAASSTENHQDEITEISQEDYERAKNAPEVTSEDSDI